MWDANGPLTLKLLGSDHAYQISQSKMVISVATVQRLRKSLARSMRTKDTSHPGGI